MLDTSVKQQLEGYMQRVTQPVEIVACLDDSPAAVEMLELLQDISSMSNLINLTQVEDESLRKPSFSISRADSDMDIRFAGIPMGHEFTSLVLALLQAGGHPPKVDDAVIEQIKALQGDFKFVSYISLSCQNCPDVVQALNLMAIKSIH